MTQYTDEVERHGALLEAREWAKGVKDIHVHSLNSMWYDEFPEDTEEGAVTDIQYNSGIIKRFKDGKVIRTFGKMPSDDALIANWDRVNNATY